MATYKDEKRGTWYCKFYYVDWTGTRRQKLKRGFKLQREAKEWERDFLEKQQGTPEMTFRTLVSLYLEDTRTRRKRTTFKAYESHCNNALLPTFGEIPINQITPSTIRAWQNSLISEQRYGQYTMLSIHNTFSRIFNFAVRYYNLPSNPCKKAGTIGKRNRRTAFWTKHEYDLFISHVEDPQAKLGFEVLYFSGCRIGELLALTPADIDTENNIIHITKTLYRENGQDTFTTPKTPKSIRDIVMPGFVIDNILAYSDRIYKIQRTDRIFTYSEQTFRNILRKICPIAGVKTIHTHDIRHSHVSLLIELDFNPLVISERLGHDNVNITLGTYAHLYPNKQDDVAKCLEDLK